MGKVLASISAPTDISGLQLWLDASSPNSFYKDAAKTQPATLESDKIAVWADKSGNGFDATNTNASNQPLLTLNKDGRYPAVQFGVSHNLNMLLNLGNPDLLNFGKSGNTGAYTIFVVYKQTAVPDEYSLLLHKGTYVTNTRTFWLSDFNLVHCTTIVFAPIVLALPLTWSISRTAQLLLATKYS